MTDPKGREGATSQGHLDDVKRILKLWRPRYIQLSLGAVMSVMALFLGYMLMGQAGGHIAGMSLGVVGISLAFLRFLGGGRVILRYTERLFTHNVMFKVLTDVRLWFFSTLARGSAAGLGFKKAGDMLSRLVSDIETLDSLYLRLLLPFVGAVATLPVLLVIIQRHSVGLAVLIGGLFILSAFVLPVVVAWFTARSGAQLSQEAAALRVAVLDVITGMKEMRIFGAEIRLLARVQARDAKLRKEQLVLARKSAFAAMLAFLSTQMAIIVVLVWFITRGANMVPMAGAMIVFFSLAAFETVGGLIHAGSQAGHIGRAASRVVAIERGAPPEDSRNKDNRAPRGHDIRFENVDFRWEPGQRAALCGVNFSVKAGEKVAIIGPSGAGKSTLTALLLKVIKPSAGRIFLGGTDIALLSDDAVRGQIAWASQATHLFNDTVRNNLLLGRPDATDHDMWKALDEAGAGEVVRSLPEGLESWIGEGGTRLSGGQGRRITLARVLLSAAPILIMDEPATGLDIDTEKAFLQTLNTLGSQRTVILITHRLTGVEQLDAVWHIAEGCIKRLSV